jgi:hypothetical protein
MELSLFLAKLLGLYLLIFAAVWLLRRNQVESAIHDLFNSPGTLALSGLINLIFGLAIAIAHPLWKLNWQGLITLIAYLAIIKGIMRLGFQEQVKKNAQIFLKKGFGILLAVMAILGAYLFYAGFLSA